MRKDRPALACSTAFQAVARSVTAQAGPDAPVKSHGAFAIHGGQPASLLNLIPATDGDAALKPFPGPRVRRRHAGIPLSDSNADLEVNF